MTDETHKTRIINTKLKPFLLGYTVRETEQSGKAYWSKVAVAWMHEDGYGYNVHMDALPVDGKLVLRTVPQDHDDTGELFEELP